MAIRPDYNVGTVALVGGSADFTTFGASLQTASVQAGDAIITPSGHVLIIASVTGQNSGTLFLACPAGAAGSALPLRIRFQPDGSRYQGAVRNLIDLLLSGNIEAFAALVGAAGLVPIFTGVGTMDLADPATFGIEDPNGSLAKLAGLILAKNKALTTDNNGNAQQIDLGTLGRSLLALATGTSTQYVRADGTLQPLNASAVGLGNVNNTSDANKPVSTAQQTALNLKIDRAGNTGLISSYVWAASTTPGQNALNLGSANNSGPTGAGFSRTINHGSVGNLSASSWFEIQHGVWHGWTMSVASNSSTVYFSMRADGSIHAPGSINGSAKNFEVDHTVDPDNYDLRHCATEAPEMLVEYRGIAKLTNGRVTVNVEDHYGVMTNTFKNLWADAHVHALQNQDGFARVRPSPINGATFDIICEDETCSDNVAWLVMARRNDPYVRWEGCTFTNEDGRLIIEFEKPE